MTNRRGIVNSGINGVLVHEGWEALRKAWLPQASAHHVNLAREAFFAGAHHSLVAAMVIMNDDPTSNIDDDQKALEGMQRELRAFLQRYELENLPTKGNG